MLWLLTGVFGIWSFGQKRAEFVYPTVLISIAALLSIWHNIEGPGPWTPDRLTINALVFAAGGPLWLAIGRAVERARGTMGLLGAPARQMSAVVALVGLGFFAALAVSPTWDGPPWAPDRAADRFVYGGLTALSLVAYFLWAAARMRRPGLVYLAELSAVAAGVFVATRMPALWQSAALRLHWPLAAAALSLALLALSYLLAHSRRVLYGRPLFYTAVFRGPAAALAGAAAAALAGRAAAAAAVLLALAAVALFGSTQHVRRLLAALGAAGGLLGAALAIVALRHSRLPAPVPAAAVLLAMAALVAATTWLRDRRRRRRA
jgi:hypothetical protein